VTASEADTAADAKPVGVPPKQAWKRLGCSNAKGYQLLAAGEIDSYTIGRARRITLASIDRYIARHLSRTGTATTDSGVAA
jgi:excisionase family DNA binding protein